MARRTVTITHIRYYKKHARTKDRYKNLAELPDGSDFLHFASSVWNGLGVDTLKDSVKQRYCEPEHPATIRDGRTLTCVARAGNYGEPSSLRDVATGQEKLTHAGDLSSTVPLRIVLCVPKSATSALLFIEHVEGANFGGKFLEHLKRAWAQRHSNWTLETELLTRGDAWYKSAELEAITAKVYKHQAADLADQGLASEVGVLQSTLKPRKGAGFLPRKLLELLEKDLNNASTILGLPETPNQVTVTLGDGDQQRTFVLGKEKTPAVRLLVTDWGQVALTDTKFRDWCLNDAPTYFKNVGVTWKTAYNTGAWDVDAAQKKLVVKDG